jgi:hypothetical protein
MRSSSVTMIRAGQRVRRESDPLAPNLALTCTSADVSTCGVRLSERSPVLVMTAFREAGRGISRMAEAKGP